MHTSSADVNPVKSRAWQFSSFNLHVSKIFPVHTPRHNSQYRRKETGQSPTHLDRLCLCNPVARVRFSCMHTHTPGFGIQVVHIFHCLYIYIYMCVHMYRKIYTAHQPPTSDNQTVPNSTRPSGSLCHAALRAMLASSEPDSGCFGSPVSRLTDPVPRF